MRARTFLPRPEYPRPDCQRGFVHGVDWLNLNGAWEFRFETSRSGREEGWHQPGGHPWPEQIFVPFCWESLAAWGEADAATNDHYFARRVFREPLAVTRENYRGQPRYEVGWYRRTVLLPENAHWQDRRIILTIGAADFFTEVWCNGQPLGQHEGGYLPFEFDITDQLERLPDGQWQAHLVVRVEDPMDNREQPVGKQWGWYTTTSGIWQTVYLEPRAPAHIERFEITSDPGAGRTGLRIFTRGGEAVEAKVTAPNGTVYRQTFPVAGGEAAGEIDLAPVVLWDPSHPQLYRLVLTLEGAARPDVVHSYFGLRTLTAAPAQGPESPSALVLNGQPIYLRGALYQSYHAEGIYTAGDVQALQDDILFAKRAGFDLLRVHLKIDDPLLLYYADTLGILLMADFPNFGEGGDTPLGRRRFEEMLRGGLARDFNHPSIVAWCLFNETWGFGGLVEFVKLINPTLPAAAAALTPGEVAQQITNQSSFAWVRAMWKLAKTLDPSRLIEDMSVVAWDHLQYYGHGETDVNSWHFYTDSYEKARAHIENVVEKTFPGSTFNTIEGVAQGAQPLINSEYGGVGALDGDVDISWSFKFLTNELRRHGKLSAYIFTELHDVEWERNGFLNYDRTPKDFGYFSTLVNQGDVLPIDAPPIQRRPAGTEILVPVYASHYSRQVRGQVFFTWRLSGIDSLGRVHDGLSCASFEIDFPQYRVEQITEVPVQLPRETMLCTLWVRATTADGTLVARNYVQILADAGHPPRETRPGVVILRAEVSAWAGAEWSLGQSRHEEAEEKAACGGRGHGFFEWQIPVEEADLARLQSLRLLCETSSCRVDTPQTDAFTFASELRIFLNGEEIYRAEMPNHPHDARGALSYLRGGKGAYGYLAHATVEGPALARLLAARAPGEPFRLRCVVPEGPRAGGLTVYGGESGRYPLPPTLILEREREPG